MPAIFKNPFGGILFLSALFFTAFLGSVFMMGPVLPLMIINPRFFRLITDHMIGIWLALPVVLMENMFDIKFYITGDKLKHNEKSVIIMNHRTRLDWLFFWTPLLRQSSVKTEKIILKHGLKQAPGFGWAMQVASYIFLRRDWKRDEKYLTSMIDYLSDLRYIGQILIFPEGTDFCDTSKPKSDSYAKKMGLSTYDYVLHPRVTGFTYLVEELRKRNMIDCIYDVSVGYPYNLPTAGEIDMMKGDLPPEVHFHVKCHSIATIPINKDGLTKWCEQKWAEKEEQLKEFYTKDKVFVTERDGLHVETYKEKIFEETSKWIVAYVLGFWGTFTVFVLAGLLYSSIIRWHFVLASIFFIVVGIFYGGIEKLTQKSFRWYKSKTGEAKIRSALQDANGNVPASHKEVHYNPDIGCPIVNHYKHTFLPVIDLYDGDVLIEEMAANYILWEVHGRSDYSYTATMQQAGCQSTAQTWQRMQELADEQQIWNYRHCFFENMTTPIGDDLLQPYEILNSTGINEIAWDTWMNDSIYQFTVLVIDPQYSFCHLQASFGVRLLGLNPSHAPTNIIMRLSIGLFAVLTLSLAFLSYLIFRKRHIDEYQLYFAPNDDEDANIPSNHGDDGVPSIDIFNMARRRHKSDD